jgi:ribosomal protein L11 methyltransferase
LEPAFVRWDVRAATAELGERAAAEAFAAGAAGLEERDTPGAFVLYAEASRAAAVEKALAPLAGAGLDVGAACTVEPRDWGTAWRAGLGPVVVSARLCVCPPFADSPHPAEATVWIEPGQAFGTGGHATTRLALELVDALPAPRREGARVLDVGTGSGVLALAALRRGAAFALGLDLDPLAAPAARANAEANALAAGLRVLTGPLAAVAAPPFDLVLANLLRSELEPLLPGLARALAREGTLILSGLLDTERALLEPRLAALGLEVEEARRRRDATGDEWLGLALRASPRGIPA